MPSSISSSSEDYWVRPMAERVAPATDWTRIALIGLLIVGIAVGTWEWAMREVGLTTADIDDGEAAWARERRKIDSGEGRDAIVGSSRLLFNTDLAEWRRLTGEAPIQLAVPGTNPRPVIADLAKDEDFRGLLIVGVDPLLFFGREGRATEMVKYPTNEPLFKRSGLWLYERLNGVFAFLDRELRPVEWLYRLPVPQRTVRGPFNAPPKLAVTVADRQTFLWDRVEWDSRLRATASAAWLVPPRRPPPKPAEVEKGIQEVVANVRRIRSRGGEVVFVRSPSEGPLLQVEERVYPRARTWDRLIAGSKSIGIHFADHPVLQHLRTIELSHLNRKDSVTFTRALVLTLHSELARRGKRYGKLGRAMEAEANRDRAHVTRAPAD